MPTALIVEDEFLIRLLAVDILQHAGYEVVETDSAEMALLHIRSGQMPDLLFTNVDLRGGLSGVELAQTVSRCWPDIHIMIVSAGRVPAAHEIPNGADFYSKPYPSDKILSRVRQLAHH